MTINNPKDGLITDMKNLDWINAGIIGEEVGDKQKTPHLQCYVQTDRMKFSTFRNRINKALKVKPHIEIAKGSVEDNVKYCSKQDTDPTIWGQWTTQGQRTDWEEIYQMIKDDSTNVEIQERYPAQYAHGYKGIDKMRSNLTLERNKQKLIESFEKVELKEWQRDAIHTLFNQGDRTVDWYVDYKGNQGKTWLAKYLIAKYNAMYVQGGKMNDIAYAYQYHPVVVFDFTRDKQDIVNYSVIESFKNGLIFSGKYESVTKQFDPCKVICFSNWDPDETKLSEDRWNIKYLSDTKTPLFQQINSDGFLFPEDC